MSDNVKHDLAPLSSENVESMKLRDERYDDEAMGDIADESEDGSSDSDGPDDSSSSEDEVATDPSAEWTDENTLRDLPFTGVPLFNIGAAESPFEFFHLLFSANFLSLLVSSINAHLESETNVDEVRNFLAMLFHMGNIKINRLNNYWKIGNMWNLPFAKYISRDRFLLLLRNFNFKDKNQYSDVISRYTQPLINYFNNKMCDLVSPMRNLILYETLVLWRGRLRNRQYLKDKRLKFGIKLYVLTDAQGLSLKMHLDKDASDPLVGGRDHANKVVMLLLKDYLNKGYSVYMDNYYNNIQLAESLLAQKTYVTGSLRPSGAGNLAFLSLRSPGGACNYKFNRKGVSIAHFNHNQRHVFTISTQHCGRRVSPAHKPDMVVEYNKYMNRINRKDQLLSYYSSYPKSLRWHQKILLYILQQMFQNAYFVYSHCQPNNKMSYFDFRINILESLAKLKIDPRSGIPFAAGSRIVANNGEVIHLGIPLASGSGIVANNGEVIHLPQSCPKDKDGRSKRRRCALCFRKTRVRKQVLFLCPRCPLKPGLCLTCFSEFHNYK